MSCKRASVMVVVVLVTAVQLLLWPQVGLGEEAKERKALVREGARLWAPYCGSCHNARPQGERSPAEWDTIMMHMRVRANLPAQDSRALLEYLKAR